MQYESNIEERIKICDRYPKNEEMLMIRAQSLKKLGSTYKFLECIERILKINPDNLNALAEIAGYLGDGNV